MTISSDDLAQIVAAVRAELEAPPEVTPMATTGYTTVAPGQTILADHMNMAIGQGVKIFPNAASRDAQLPGPTVGMMCYLTDLNIMQIYDSQITGGANYWRPAGGLRIGYARMGLNQSIPGGSKDTLVKLDTAGGTSNRPGRGTWNADGSVTVPYTGTYLVTGSVCWPANSTGERRASIQRYTASAWTFNSVAGGATEINTGAVGSTLLRQSITAMMYLNAGDKFGLHVQHSASTALVLTGGADQAKLAGQLLAAD